MPAVTLAELNGADKSGFVAMLGDIYEHAPRMMSVGLHCRLAGRPGRAAGLIRFLDHLAKRERVWVARRIDIARHWHDMHGALAANARAIG